MLNPASEKALDCIVVSTSRASQPTTVMLLQYGNGQLEGQLNPCMTTPALLTKSGCIRCMTPSPAPSRLVRRIRHPTKRPKRHAPFTRNTFETP